MAGEEEYKLACRKLQAIQKSAPQRSQQRTSVENRNFSISREDLRVPEYRDYRPFSPEKAKFLGERSGMFADARLGGGGCSRRLNRLCQQFPVSGNDTGNLSAFSARDLTVGGKKHRIKPRFYPVEMTARGSGTGNSGQVIREFRSNCRIPGSISSIPLSWFFLLQSVSQKAA